MSSNIHEDDSDDTNLVITELTDGVLIIRLNDPDRLNAISNEMRARLERALIEASDDHDVRAVVITGTGRAFTAGGDVKASEQGSATAALLRDRLRVSHRMLAMPILSMTKPTIAALNGVTAGAGISIALACDLRVAARHTKFVLAFSAIGLVPDLAIGYLLPRLIGLGRAKDVLLTRDRLSAEEAEALGMVNEVVDDDCVTRAVEIARGLADKPQVAIELTKRMLDLSLDHTLATFLEMESTYQAIASQTPEHIAARTAFLTKSQAGTASKSRES